MSEKTTTDVIDNDADNQNNDGFSAVIIAVILLVCLWIVAGFTVFKYVTLILLTVHFVNTFRLNSTSNRQETRINPSTQICARCSSRTNDDCVVHSLPVQMNESEAVVVREDEHMETSLTITDRQRNSDYSIEQDDTRSILTNGIEQIPESEGNHITNLIQSTETIAVLITPADDNSTTACPTPIQQTTTEPTTTSATPKDLASVVTPKSAYVTENVMKVAVSYSGKQRKRVLKITRILQRRMSTSECPYPVFFDQDFQHEICRLNGGNHLLSIYRQAQLVIVFLSPTYADSKYCYDEWRTIANRFLSNPKNKEATQLLLIKLGEYDMEQLGLVDRDFALNGIRRTNEEIADIIFRRWETIEKNIQDNNQ